LPRMTNPVFLIPFFRIPFSAPPRPSGLAPELRHRPTTSRERPERDTREKRESAPFAAQNCTALPNPKTRNCPARFCRRKCRRNPAGSDILRSRNAHGRTHLVNLY
jgi:hypothetical protein